MAGSGQRIVKANGAELCVETFGDPGNPAILLISEAAAPMDYWEDEFCDRLAAGGRFVVRYDHRDTGRSVSYRPAPRHTPGPIWSRTRWVCSARSGWRAPTWSGSRWAEGSPSRQPSLSRSGRVAHADVDQPDLDQPRYARPPAHVRPAPGRPFAGSLPVDEAHLRELAGRIVDRTTDIAASLTNHWIIDSGDAVAGPLTTVTAPTLVLHGTEDPLLPYGHGQALAREIAGARLIALPGMGHQVPRAVWDVVIPAILTHTATR